MIVACGGQFLGEERMIVVEIDEPKSWQISSELARLRCRLGNEPLDML